MSEQQGTLSNNREEAEELLEFSYLSTVSKSGVQLPAGLETKKEKAPSQVASIEVTIFAEDDKRKIKGAPD